MIIESLNLKNFRSFVDPVDLQLRPLTLLYGYNSAGKSALLRALPLTAASLRTQETAPIALVSPAARQARFVDLLPHPALSASRHLSLGLVFRAGPLDSPKSLALTWRIRDLPEIRQQVIEEFEVDAPNDFHIAASWNPATMSPIRPANHYTLHISGQQPLQADINFRGLMPAFSHLMTPPPECLARLPQLLRPLSDERANVQWLNSVRRAPGRLIPWRNTPPSSLEPDGSGASDILAYDDLEKGPILPEVSAWYEKHLNLRLKVSQIVDQYQLLVEPLDNSPVQVYLQDVGEGLAQVLPVLVASARLRANPNAAPRILAAEEPESHLHPRLHAALAEKFCELAALPDPPQIILETHSENILLAVQLAVAEQKLSPQNVLVYWVRQSRDGRSRAEPVEFDALGHPKGNWPPGVFADDIDQARKLISVQRSRASQ